MRTPALQSSGARHGNRAVESCLDVRIGGLLELVGIGLVAWDVRDAHLNVTRRLTPERMKELLDGKMPNQFTLTVAAATLVAGSIRRRLLGVGLLALGVLVQVIGNIAAL